ncbi:MAG: creatininase family protein [Pseudomonadota bacterium]
MTPAEIAKADTSDWIGILPFGAHEQHGPHLPFETDTTIANGIACRLAGALDDDFPATFLPAESVGYSPEHMDYEGSQTLSYAAAIERWIGIGEKLSQQGIYKLLLLNAHGGNSPLMTIVSTELRVRFDMLCVATSWTRFIEPGEIISAEEKAYGIHGGDIETSVMLALAPDTVVMDKAENFGTFQQELANENQYLRGYGPHAFGWKMQDLNTKGVTGNAALATAEKGNALITQAVSGLQQLLYEMRKFDLKYFQG